MKNSLHILTISVLGIFASACQEQIEANEEGAQEEIILSDAQLANAQIELGELSTRTLTQTISCRGIIDVPPSNRASLTTAFGGYVTYTSVYPGEVVKKGQLLARLQDPLYIDLQRSYLEGKSRLTYLESDFKRKEDLRKNESVSEKVYQQSLQQVEAVRAEVSALKAQLKIAGINVSNIEKNGIQDQVEVRAPMDGFITAVNVNLGTHLQEGDALYELIDPSHVHVELNIYPNDLPNLAIGQKVVYQISGSEEERTGSIYLINKAVQTDSRSIVVHVHPDDEEDANQVPGTFVQAAIIFNSKEVVAIPRNGVIKRGPFYVAFKHTENGFEEINFSPSLETDDFLDASTLPQGNYILSGAQKVNAIAPDHSH